MSPKARHARPSRLADPAALRQFHGWATVGWILLVPITLTLFSSSIPWLAAMSVWANVVGHWGAWQAARVEDPQT